MENPTSEQKYEFVQEHISKLKKNESANVIMEGRVYKVTYVCPKDEVIFAEEESA